MKSKHCVAGIVLGLVVLLSAPPALRADSNDLLPQAASGLQSAVNSNGAGIRAARAKAARRKRAYAAVSTALRLLKVVPALRSGEEQQGAGDTAYCVITEDAYNKASVETAVENEERILQQIQQRDLPKGSGDLLKDASPQGKLKSIPSGSECDVDNQLSKNDVDAVFSAAAQLIELAESPAR